MADCLFCRIAAGEIPATRVAEDEHCIAFRDIGPQAPVHVLVIPRLHVANMDAAEATPELMGRVFAMAARVARELGIAERGYRTVLNTNADGGQTVHHLHAHVLGGRSLGWPPG